MWIWLVIVAALILLWVFWQSQKGSKSSSQQGQGGQTGGFGSALLPSVVINRFRPPHQGHHHHHRGGGDGERESDAQEDREHEKDHDHHRHQARMRRERSPGGEPAGAGTGTDVPVGVDRRPKRGEAVPGFLVDFKTSEKGQTPSLQDVANNYDTSPEAIIQEAEGRGYPSSVAWKRYVSRHDWASPLPPATQFQILAHPN